jgi:DNA-binding NtrC family response regulator
MHSHQQDVSRDHAAESRRSGTATRGMITMLGVSPAIRGAVALARRVAPTGTSVLISGEAGTGKRLLAQFIHVESRRVGGEFAPVNCAEAPEQSLACEIFGCRKEAFPGAEVDRPGLLETAGGGTVFLEQLTAMPHALQLRLLDALESGEVRRLGSQARDALLNVRFISATSRDPWEAVDAGVLRRDLFYRLAVVSITLPSLRDRPEDIPILAKCFLADYWERYRRTEGPAPQLAEAALDVLRARPWCGNVDELRNVVEHLAVFAEPGGCIRPEDIPFSDAPISALVNGPFRPAVIDDEYHQAKDAVVALFEKVYLARVVDRAHGNIAKAARLAGIDRATLYRLMDKHGLRRDELGRTTMYGVHVGDRIPRAHDRSPSLGM